MSTKFYPLQTDYIEKLNELDDDFAAAQAAGVDAVAQAEIATDQAEIATTQAGISTTQAGLSAASAAAASGSQSNATAQAVIATAQAALADADRVAAEAAKVAAEAAWTAALAANPDLNPAIRMNPSTLHADLTIPAGYSAYSAAPLTIGEGVNVTIEDFAEWTII